MSKILEIHTIQIEYHDNGIGITEYDIKKIFDPFFTTNMGTNTGLRMNIVYNIITQQFGGSIMCKNSRGKRRENMGAHFYIALPQINQNENHAP